MKRIGLTLSGFEDRPLAEVLGYARLAEELGYEAIFCPEAWGRDAFLVLSQVAVNTRRALVGTGIVNVYSRTPALMAMTAATLDEIAGGRLILGLGTSGPKVIEGFHGVPMARPLQRLREYTEIIRKVVRGDRRPYEGELFKLEPGFRLMFSPVRDRIPIWIASLSPAALRLTGEIADGWLPFLLPVDEYPQAMRHLAEGLARAGRAREEITVAPFIVARASDDPEEALMAVKQHIAFYVGGMGDYYYNLIARHGYREVGDRIRAAWAERRRQEAAAAVPAALADAVGVWGTPEQCRAKMERFRLAGADLPVVYIPHNTPPDKVEMTLRALATPSGG